MINLYYLSSNLGWNYFYDLYNKINGVIKNVAAVPGATGAVQASPPPPPARVSPSERVPQDVRSRYEELSSFLPSLLKPESAQAPPLQFAAEELKKAEEKIKKEQEEYEKEQNTNNKCKNFIQQHKILGGVSFSFSIFLIFIII